MARTDRVRIVNTNDFFGSYAPMGTSYGSLPGGEGLKQTVERLRESQPTIWADDGDFSEGGPLAPMTNGVGGFEAAADLGIDVGAIGNHDFDWGLEHLQEHGPTTGFPLLCANADAGFPATHVIATEAGDVGFVGITSPEADVYAPGAPKPDPDLAGVVVGASERLRKEGADFVVALFHDGVDSVYAGPQPPEMDAGRFAARCRPWISSVDAVVAGHTLGRFFGHLEGVPVALPWAFGAEVGVIDLSRGAGGDVYGDLHGMSTEPGGPWTGAGAELITRAGSQVIGNLDGTLYRIPGESSPLLDFMARALRAAAGADAALVPGVEGGYHQPPLDGVLSFLPEGEITEADLLRVVYWIDDSTVRLELAAAELAAFERAAWGYPSRGCGLDVLDRARTRSTLSVAMSSWSASQLEAWLGRPVESEETGFGLRDAVRAAFGSSVVRARSANGPRELNSKGDV